MATKLYLIRHGATEGSDAPRYKGSIDVPLSAEGIAQMEKTARFISGLNEPPRAIYSSGLRRAMKSAAIVSAPIGLQPVIVSDLRERNFGLWEGMSFDEIRDKYPEEFKSWASDPLRFSPMGGESTLELRDRVIIALEEIAGRHKDDAVVVVAHGGVNRIIICHYAGIPLDNIFRVEQDFAAVSIIELYDSYPVLKLLNYRP